MEFYFPLNPTGPRDLRRVFEQHQRGRFFANFPELLGKLTFAPTRGFMKGYVDLDGKLHVQFEIYSESSLLSFFLGKLGSAIADVSAVPPDRVAQGAGIERRDDVPGLTDQYPTIFVLRFPVGVAQQHAGLVFGDERPLEVDLHLGPALGTSEERNRRALDVDAHPGPSSVDDEHAFAMCVGRVDPDGTQCGSTTSVR